jgi:ABC-2 type transport system ATP-binding protein
MSSSMLSHQYAASGDPALEASDLVKTYPGGRRAAPVRALDGLSLAVPAGRVLALLGRNGAGKSTTVRVLATLSRPDSGSARVGGLDVRRRAADVRRTIGLVSQRPGSDPMATGRENIVLAGRIHGLSARDARARAEALLERFDLRDAADRLAKTYSGGMSRKLDVALGLVHRPTVLFLDEPTTGLDPEARAQMWAEVASLASDEGVTILLTTHHLDEADHLADEVAIIDDGRVVVRGSPEALKDELEGDALVLELEDADASAEVTALLASVDGITEVTRAGSTARARTSSGAHTLPLVLARVERCGTRVLSATISRPSLDDVYLRYVGSSLDAEDVATEAASREVVSA